MAIFWKNISSDLAQNGPKYLSRTNLHFNNNFGSGTHQKIFTTAILSFLTWLASPLGETVVPAQEWSECPGIKLDYFIYCHSRPFGPFWAILGHFGSFWAILGHFGSFWVILGHFGPFWVILGHFGSFWVILDHFGSFWAILGHLVEFWLQKHHLHCIVKFKKNAPNLDFLCRE